MVYSMHYSSRIDFLTQVLVALALLAALVLGLLPALLAGLLVYHIVEFGAQVFERSGLPRRAGRLLLVLFVTLFVIMVCTFGIIGFASQVTDGPESFTLLMSRMADVIDTGRSYLPLWVQPHVPANIEEWQVAVADWLRGNANSLSLFGQEIGMLLAHVVLGIIIGAMVALNPGFQTINGPFSQALHERCERVADAFRRIVFSQIKISALNTVLTGIFLMFILPTFGSPLPLTNTLIAVTFIAGLLPIIGNLISNTVIFLIALSVSAFDAVASLAFLIVLHKLEYFFNAHIIGTHIRSRAWELLIAMIAMKAAFGIPGLVAAPIYYAYAKDELAARKLI